MRVAELTGIRQFRLSEVSIDPPGPGEVQVRVQAVGICGSDMHAYSEGAVGDTKCAYPMVLGHEPAGVVVKAGAGVTEWTPGDAAAFEPAIYCYHCALCVAGRHNLCANLKFLSSPTEPGFFRECVNLPAHNLVRLPAGVSVDEGTLIEPLAVALHSMKFVALGLGETVAVLGAGPIGLLTVAALKQAGAGRIFVVEPLAHRRALAMTMGADVVLDPADAAAIRADTSKRGVDVAIDCAAKGDTANLCLDLARSGGRVVYTGIPSEIQVALNFHTWRRKELALFQVRRSNHEGPAARDMLARHKTLLGPLVTHRRPLEQIDRAFAVVDRYEDGVAKMIVRLD